MLATVAWRNLTQNKRRFIATTIGVAFSVLLIILQLGLLLGFTRAAESIVRSATADLWIAPPGVTSLEYSSPLDERLGDRLWGIPGVVGVAPLTSSFAEWRSGGLRTGVVLIGLPDDPGSGLPRLQGGQHSSGSWAEPMVVNEVNARSIRITRVDDTGEINGHRVVTRELLHAFPTFLGSPYVFVDVDFARTVARMLPEKASFLLVRVADSAEPRGLKASVADRLPGYGVYTADEFARRTSDFWLAQTGAGGGFILAAVMGFIVGLVLVSVTLYTNVIEHLREYATLKAIGASGRAVGTVVLWEAMISGAAGGLLGLAVSIPAVAATRAFLVPWLWAPWSLRGIVFMVGLAMCALASVTALRTVLREDPMRIFRT